MTVGMLMYYGGMAGTVTGMILMMFLTRLFTAQRKKKRNSINGLDQD